MPKLKKINEELLPIVKKKTKRVWGQGSYKNFWETGLTAGKLKKLLKDVPDDIPIVQQSVDHTYDSVNIKFMTALFDCEENTINEDYGEDITPQSKFGRRKEVILIT